jgi:hypothetical protein
MNDREDARDELQLENLVELDAPVGDAAKIALAGVPDLFDGKVHVMLGKRRGSPGDSRRIYPTRDRRGVTLLEANAAPMKSWETWELGIVREFAKRRGWITHESVPGGFDLTPGVVGKEYRVDRSLLSGLNAVAKRGGFVAEIVSGYRSYASQLKLWLLYLAGLGNPANRPGTSNHEADAGEPAKAADVYVRGVPFWTYVNKRPTLAAYARRIGLRQPHSHEPWHVERS